MIKLGGYQDQGKRKEQQDSFGFLDSKNKEFEKHAGKLAIVADGMGGLAQGKDASTIAIKKFIESYSQKTPQDTVPVALLRALHHSNKAVFEYSETQGKDGRIGTTLVASVIKDNELFWVSVGDSRIYLLQKGQVSLLTTDHCYETKLEELYAEGKVTREDVDSHPQKASLTSYIGSEEIEYIHRNTSPLKISDQDKVLLCSDGLYSRLSDQDLISLVTDDPAASCKRLVEKKLSMAIKSQDNLTAVLMKYSGGSKSEGNSQIGGNPLIIFSIVIFIIAGYLFFNQPAVEDEKDLEVVAEEKIQESSVEDSSTSSEMVEEELDPSAISDEPEESDTSSVIKDSSESVENQIQDNISSSEETISEDDESSPDVSISEEDEKFIKIEEEKDIVGENIIEQETKSSEAKEIQSYSVIGEEVIEVVTSQNESSAEGSVEEIDKAAIEPQNEKEIIVYDVIEGDKVAEGDDIVNQDEEAECITNENGNTECGGKEIIISI